VLQPTQPVSRLTDEEIERRVLMVVARALDRPVSEVHPYTSLEADLGAQSLDYLDIAFSLEREFRIAFPRADFLQRAGDHFGEENLVKDGVITNLGLQLLAKGMPELDPANLRPGLRVTDLRRMFVVATLIRVVKQLLEHKASMDRKCPGCGVEMEESLSLPEFVCPACKTNVPVTPGDEVLFQHLLDLEEARKTDGEGAR
jgi:acyl carrier protein